MATETVAVRASREAGGATRWFAAPIMLGALQAIAACVLVLIELAQPAPQADFGGIAFSNAIASRRSRAAVDLFRDRVGWPDGADGDPRTLTPTGYLRAKRLGVTALAILQVAALLACLRRRRAGPLWPWTIGPTLSVTVLLLMPPVSTDVFYYAAAGNLAHHGVNPYLTAPGTVAAGDPFTPFNDWAHITTQYGPVWTGLSRLVVVAAGPDPFRAALGLKLLAAACAIGLGLVTAAVAGRLTDRRRLVAAALVVVAWQPGLLLESAGAAHLDATMMLLAVGGLAAIASGRRGGVRGGLALIAAGALTKPVIAPLLALAALWRLAEARRDGRNPAIVLRRWLGDAAAMLAILALAFAPYWSGGELWRTLTGESKRLYLDEALGVNAFWFWLMPRLPLVPEGDPWLRLTAEVVRPATVALTAALLVVAWLWLLTRSWPWRTRRRPVEGARGDLRIALRDQVVAWAVATAALGFLPVNAHAWYAIWPLAPVALAWVATAPERRRSRARATEAGDRPLPPGIVPWWLWLVMLWSLTSFLIYHTHPLAGVEAT